MHVLILPSWYFDAGTPDIAGRMFHHLAKGLGEEGIDARILYASFSPKDPFFRKTSFSEEEGVLTWRSSQFFLPKGNQFLMQVWIHRYVDVMLKYIRNEGKPDLIHAHSYLAAAVCAVLQEKIQIPFIYTERLSSFVLEKIPKYHYPFLKGCFEKASQITCVSPGLLDRMQPHTQKRIKVIPNFFDENLFYPDRKIEKYPSFTWLSIGEPAHIKGLDLLLRAFAGLKEKLRDIPMQLMLIDEIPEKQELNKLAESLGIAAFLSWTGLITQTEIAEHMRRSHVLVSASRVETFGKAIIEAQACGLPVVATRTDGAVFILNSSRQGELAEVGSIESLMHAMGKVYAGYASYDDDAIHAIVQKRFSRKVIIHQWMECYKSVGV
jgi:glycosyltransferase involved in cell wall biosynthesis